jgi:hypothetical protein
VSVSGHSSSIFTAASCGNTGCEIKLQGQPIQVLTMLLQHPGDSLEHDAQKPESVSVKRSRTSRTFAPFNSEQD